MNDFLVSLRKLNFFRIKDLHENFKLYQILVFLLRVFAELKDKCWPALYPRWQIIEDLCAFLFEHFNVDWTILGPPLRVGPAVGLLARVGFGDPWLVLPKVQKLGRVYLRAHCYLEVFVADLAVLVRIERVEQIYELVRGQEKAPVVQIVLQLTLLDSARF